MFPKQEVVAMLLAGGQGSRLGVLTTKLAKPAVPFGGKYRIIDFPLSNCVNSGIEAVGVLTQYQPLVLNEYIGNGQPWDLDGMNSGVQVLSPYQRSRGADWYKGTANAIYQNMNYIERYNPDYVVILSGDHIYKMDYSKMVAYHKEKGADCTIAVIDVPLSEASRFGIPVTYTHLDVYKRQDPRAVLLKQHAKKLAGEKGMLKEFELYERVERLAPQVFAKVKGDKKVLCANVDFYSGLVYQMLGLPSILYTPMFAVSRIAGWCAHRMEEVYTGSRIIRPAYKSLVEGRKYIPIDKR